MQITSLLILLFSCILISCNQGKTSKLLADTLQPKTVYERLNSDTFYFPAPKKQFSSKILLLNSRSIIFNDSISEFYMKEQAMNRQPKGINNDEFGGAQLEYQTNGDTVTVNMMHMDLYKNRYRPLVDNISNDTIWLDFHIIDTFCMDYPFAMQLNTWKFKIKDKSKTFKPIIFSDPFRCPLNKNHVKTY